MNEIQVKKGSIVKECVTADIAKTYLMRIYDDMQEVKHGFIKLAFHLDEIKRCEYYKVTGYEDFYEFCEVNYGLEKTKVKRYIEIWDRFAKRQPGSRISTMFIDEKYADYNYSQLCEMVSMEYPEKVRPNMTIKEIRELKKSEKRVKLNVVSGCDVAPEKCRFDESYLCKIEAISKKHFMKNGDIVGCAGCCQCCTDRSECEYVCDVVKDQEKDVAQNEIVPDESEIDMQRDNMLEQLDRVQKTIDSFSMFLTLDQVRNISDEMNVLQCMIKLLH